jgi:hypothetical protein
MGLAEYLLGPVSIVTVGAGFGYYFKASNRARVKRSAIV